MTISLSIIIPVYNGSEFIEKLVSSIMSLTFKDYEVIIINDGSSDDTYEKLVSFVGKNDKFRIINQINKGVASSRNLGIELAIGKWLFFLDADDTISHNYFNFISDYEHYYIKGSAVVVINGVYDDYGKVKSKWHPYCFEKKNVDNIPYVLNTKIMKYVWGKLYSREFVIRNNIKFEKYNIAEDFLFNVKLCLMQPTLININAGYYYYYQNTNAVTKSYTADNLLCRLRVVNRIFELLTQQNIKLELKPRLYMEFFLYQTLKHLNKLTVDDKMKVLDVIKDNRSLLKISQIPMLPISVKGKLYFLFLIGKYRLWE